MPKEDGTLSIEEFTSSPLPVTEVPPVETKETEDEESSDEESSDEEESPDQSGEVEDLDENAIKEAKALYKMLKGDNATEVVRMMAKNVGLLQDPPETKQEVKAAKKSMTAILKDKLGEFGFLAEKLGPALDEMFEEVRAESAQRAVQLERREIDNDVVKATAKLNKESKGEFGKLEKEISRLADKIKPGADTSVEEYMRSLYVIASSQSKVDPKTLSRRIEQNRTNASDRVRTSQQPEPAFDRNTKRTLKESIRVAAESLSRQK